MQEVGHAFESILNNSDSTQSILASSGHKIHWFQIYIYDFGFGQLPRPKHWHNIVLDNMPKERKNNSFTIMLMYNHNCFKMNQN